MVEIPLTFHRVASCNDAIDRWMSLNRIKLNVDKIQFLVLGSKLQLAKVKCDSIRLGGLDKPFLQKVTCLVVILDAELSMVKHVLGVTSRCFYQLRQIHAIRKSLIASTTKLLMYAFINSRLDYFKGEQCISENYSHFKIGLHGLSHENENMTKSPQHIESICTGWL